MPRYGWKRPGWCELRPETSGQSEGCVHQSVASNLEIIGWSPSCAASLWLRDGAKNKYSRNWYFFLKPHQRNSCGSYVWCVTCWTHQNKFGENDAPRVELLKPQAITCFPIKFRSWLQKSLKKPLKTKQIPTPNPSSPTSCLWCSASVRWCSGHEYGSARVQDAEYWQVGSTKPIESCFYKVVSHQCFFVTFNFQFNNHTTETGKEMDRILLSRSWCNSLSCNHNTRCASPFE